MYCVTCKSSTLLPGARYCARCGAPLQALLWSGSESAPKRNVVIPESDEMTRCERCGKPNPPEHRHCAYCGSRLGDGFAAHKATGDERERSAEMVAAARQAMAKSQVDRARSLCEEAVSLDPSNAVGHALLAEILHRGGSLGGALQEMTTALRLDPENTEYSRRLRELRDEQDRAVAPILSTLREPPVRRARTRRPRPERTPGAGWGARRTRGGGSGGLRLSHGSWQPPQWVRGAAVILAVMAVLAVVQVLTSRSVLAAGAVESLRLFVMVALGIVITIFVYRDASSQRMPAVAVWTWTAVVALSQFLFPGYGLLSLLAYLLVTRTGR